MVCCFCKSQNVDELDRRLIQLRAVDNGLESFHHQLDELQQLVDSSESDVEGYKQCITNVDDLEAVRNSFKVRSLSLSLA